MPTGPPAEPPPVGSRGADDLAACPTKEGAEEPGTMVGDLLLTRALFTEALSSSRGLRTNKQTNKQKRKASGRKNKLSGRLLVDREKENFFICTLQKAHANPTESYKCIITCWCRQKIG
jgi:hypothetical protein